MKIIKLLMCFLLIFIVGCESAHSHSSISKVDRKNFELQDLGIVSKVSLLKRGDIVIKQETENRVNYYDAAIDRKKHEQEHKAMVEQYKNTPGVEYEINYGEKEVVEKFTVDYRLAKIEDLKKLPAFIMPLTSSEQVRYSDVAVLLVDYGYKRVES